MEPSSHAEEFIPAGLDSLGIEADETELAVMAAAHQLFWPGIRALLSFDMGGIEAEHCPDLSRGPRTERGRS